VFWALLSSSEHSGVPEDSNPHFFQVLGFTPTLGQSRVATKEVKRKKRKEKRWEEIHILKVVEVRSLNLNLDLLWKDFEVKLGEIVEDYKMLLFSKLQKKRMRFVRVMSFWRFCVRFDFLVISPLFELFWIYSFKIL
jgi:hypothetical protein